MKKITCKNCGNVYEIPDEKKEGFCTNCGTLNKIVEEKPKDENLYDSLLRKGFVYLKNSEFVKANQVFDTAIDNKELCGSAYLGKLYADYEATSYDDFLTKLEVNVLEDNNLNLAYDLGDKETKKKVDDIKEEVKKVSIINRYNFGIASLNKGTAESLDIAISIFTKLEGYKDSNEKIKECKFKQILLQNSRGISINVDNLEPTNKLISELNDLKDFQPAKAYVSRLEENIEQSKICYKENYLLLLKINYPSEASLKDLNNIISLINIASSRKELNNPEFPELLEGFNKTKKDAQDYVFGELIKLSKHRKNKKSILEISSKFLSTEQNAQILNLFEKKKKQKLIVEKPKKVKKRLSKKKILIISICGGIASAIVIATATTIGVMAGNYNKGVSLMENDKYYEAYYCFNNNLWGDSKNKAFICKTINELNNGSDKRFNEKFLSNINNIIEEGSSVKLVYKSESYVQFFEHPFTMSDLKTANKDGYRFNNWLITDIDYIGRSLEVTLTSEFSVITYKIEYILNGGINYWNNPVIYNINQEYSLFAATRKNFIFLGWTNEKGLTIDRIYRGSCGDLVLTANWKSANKLAAPVVSRSGKVLSWNAVTNAKFYEITINGVVVEDNWTSTTYDLDYDKYKNENNLNIKVRARKDKADESYDSEYAVVNMSLGPIEVVCSHWLDAAEEFISNFKLMVGINSANRLYFSVWSKSVKKSDMSIFDPPNGDVLELISSDLFGDVYIVLDAPIDYFKMIFEITISFHYQAFNVWNYSWYFVHNYSVITDYLFNV